MRKLKGEETPDQKIRSLDEFLRKGSYIEYVLTFVSKKGKSKETYIGWTSISPFLKTKKTTLQFFDQKVKKDSRFFKFTLEKVSIWVSSLSKKGCPRWLLDCGGELKFYDNKKTARRNRN